MKIHEIDQRSPEWYALHVGRLTGSCASAMLAMLKRGGESEYRIKLRRRLVAERLTGLFSDEVGPYLPFAMQRGVELEPAAFAAYEAQTGQLVDRVGFCEHDTLMAGCSPDGVVEDYAGIIELKCPKSTTHLEYWQGGAVPEEYAPQIFHNLWITGAAWCDFVSFDDRFPPEFQMFRVRVTREQASLPAYEAAAVAFLAEVDRDLAATRALVAVEQVA